MFDVLLELSSASPHEEVMSPSYYLDNRRRTLGEAILQYTWCGEGRVRRGRKVQKCGAGQALLMLEGDRTEYYYPMDSRTPWKFTWVNFSGARSVVAELIRLHGDVIRLDSRGETVRALNVITHLYETKNFVDRYHAAEMIAGLVCSMGRELAGLRNEGEPPIRQALNYLRDHHRRPINIKEVAAKFSLSREHFSRVFHAETGVTPAHFLRDLRLQTSRSLLLGTRMPVGEIAEKSGFSSPTHFCRSFKAAFGFPPDSFRERMAVLTRRRAAGGGKYSSRRDF